MLEEPQQVGARRVLLVDKPGAAQSVVRIARVGAARSTPDYYALDVLNTILGGSFTSRLNQNLRERNGYSYGAGSAFSFRPVAGPFTAYADVQTDVTAPALTEFFNELSGIAETVPDDGADQGARQPRALVPSSPFATVRGTASPHRRPVARRPPRRHLRPLLRRRPRGHRRRPRPASPASTSCPTEVVVVVVGDRAVIEDDVRALDLGPMEVLSVEDVLGAE